jgi:hypothetical protein
LTQLVKKLIDYGRDDHPEDADTDKAQAAWSVAILDDCDGCDDLRVELVLEEVGQAGYGQVAHLAPATARRVGNALSKALKELGEGGL